MASPVTASVSTILPCHMNTEKSPREYAIQDPLYFINNINEFVTESRELIQELIQLCLASGDPNLWVSFAMNFDQIRSLLDPAVAKILLKQLAQKDSPWFLKNINKFTAEGREVIQELIQLCLTSGDPNLWTCVWDFDKIKSLLDPA